MFLYIVSIMGISVLILVVLITIVHLFTRNKKLYKKFVNDYAYEHGELTSEYPYTVSRLDISKVSYLRIKYEHESISSRYNVVIIDFYYHGERFDSAIVSSELIDNGFDVYVNGFYIQTSVDAFERPYKQDIERFMRDKLQEEKDEIKAQNNAYRLERKKKKDSYDGLY